METKYYGVKVPFSDKDDYLFVTRENGLPWHTDSYTNAQLFAESWSGEAIVVELTEEDLLE